RWSRHCASAGRALLQAVWPGTFLFGKSAGACIRRVDVVDVPETVKGVTARTNTTQFGSATKWRSRWPRVTHRYGRSASGGANRNKHVHGISFGDAAWGHDV